MSLPRSYRLTLAALVFAALLLAACQPGAPHPTNPLARFSGNDAQSIDLKDQSGPVILHVRAQVGNEPFRLELLAGQNSVFLLDSPLSVDEYRGAFLDPAQSPTLRISGDRAWTLSLYPADPAQFDHLKIPGVYRAAGNAVFFLDGEYGVATFSNGADPGFHAWAFGPGGVQQELSITASGDYKGKSVLPQGAAWIVVSARFPWSVAIAAP